MVSATRFHLVQVDRAPDTSSTTRTAVCINSGGWEVIRPEQHRGGPAAGRGRRAWWPIRWGSHPGLPWAVVCHDAAASDRDFGFFRSRVSRVMCCRIRFSARGDGRRPRRSM